MQPNSHLLLYDLDNPDQITLARWFVPKLSIEAGTPKIIYARNRLAICR
jgi:hypothetical protein